MLGYSVWSHVIDCIALGCSVTMVYSVVETWLLGLPVGVSINARFLTLLLIVLGIGSAFSQLRAWSIRNTRVIQSNSQVVRVAHDMAFTVATNAVLAPAIYRLSGADRAQLLAGTFATIIIATISGPLNGLSIDLFRSWAGFDSNARFRPHTPPAVLRILIALATCMVAIGIGYWAAMI